MKKHLLLLIVSALLASLLSCVEYRPPKPHEVKASRVYAMTFDDAWAKAVKWFAINNSPIKNLDKSSGLIATEYGLSTEWQGLCDCGEPGSGQRITKQRGNFNVLIEARGASGVEVTVTLFIKAVLIAPAPYGSYEQLRFDIDCVSTGALESELLDYIEGKKKIF